MSVKTNLIIDLGIFSAFLVALEPGLTGIAIHEWFSAALAATLIFHILLHWKWVVNVTVQFFKKLLHSSRLQLVIDILLFAAFTTLMTSGLMISKSILPTLGLQAVRSQSFRMLHVLSANATLVLVGLHFAMNWNWVVNAVKRYAVTPLKPLLSSTRHPSAVPVEATRRQSFIKHHHGV